MELLGRHKKHGASVLWQYPVSLLPPQNMLALSYLWTNVLEILDLIDFVHSFLVWMSTTGGQTTRSRFGILRQYLFSASTACLA